MCARILAHVGHPHADRRSRPVPRRGRAAATSGARPDAVAGRQPAPCQSRELEGAGVSPRAARASRWTRCATSATAARASRATPWPRSPRAGVQRSRWWRRTRASSPRRGSRSSPVQTARELQQVVEAAAKDADVVVMAAAVADFRPGALRRRQDQEDARRGRPRRGAHHRAGAQPRHPGRPRRGARRGGQPGHRRLRGRDRRRVRRRARARQGQARPQGLRPARRQRGGHRQDVRRRTTTPSTSCGRDRATSSTRAQPASTRSPPQCGTPCRRSC